MKKSAKPKLCEHLVLEMDLPAGGGDPVRVTARQPKGRRGWELTIPGQAEPFPLYSHADMDELGRHLAPPQRALAAEALLELGHYELRRRNSIVAAYLLDQAPELVDDLETRAFWHLKIGMLMEFHKLLKLAGRHYKKGITLEPAQKSNWRLLLICMARISYAMGRMEEANHYLNILGDISDFLSGGKQID